MTTTQQHDCPTEVQWTRVFFKPLLQLDYTLIAISPIPENDVLIPSHLEEDGIRGFSINIFFEDEYSDTTRHRLHDILDRVLSWESIDYTRKIIHGGEIYRRPSQNGYWRLRSPCLDCYIRLTEQYPHDVEQLQKMAILKKLPFRTPIITVNQST